MALMITYFDEDAPLGEQLPRRLTAVLVNEPCPEGGLVRTMIDGIHVGIPLVDVGWSPVTDDDPENPDGTDAPDTTGARWHDALHVAHAVCLGWSPVLRELLDRRRISDPRTADAEDGAAAVRAEEQIAWTVFQFARSRAGEVALRPDADLLAAVRELTAGLEVEARSDDEWLHALDAGLTALRALWIHGGGELHGDLELRTLDFRPLSPTDRGRSPMVEHRIPAAVQ
jgi:hypothetical protein